MSQAEVQNFNEYVLTYKCADELGVLAKVSGCMYEKGAFVTEVSHYGDPETKIFFARTVFDDRTMKVSIDDFTTAIENLANEIGMEYQLRPVAQKPKVLLAVSKYDHCLSALLTKWKSGALPADIVGVFSNHEDCRSMAEWYGLPYHYLPITKDTKPQQEAQILELMDKYDVDLLVLARYMQILSDDLSEKLAGRAINIHHSFLPGFKGAKPYHQAHERGVKVIGATAHFVTADLDEGPIIAQEVEHIDHRVTVEQMVHIGHDNEAFALSKAVRMFCEQRIVMNGERTVIL